MVRGGHYGQETSEQKHLRRKLNSFLLCSKSPPNSAVLWGPGSRHRCVGSSGPKSLMGRSPAGGRGCGHPRACLGPRHPHTSPHSWLWQLLFHGLAAWASPKGRLQQGHLLPPAQLIRDRERERIRAKKRGRESPRWKPWCFFAANVRSDIPSRLYSVSKPSPYSAGGDSIMVPQRGRDHTRPSLKLPTAEVGI